MLTRRRLLVAGLGALLPAACRPAPDTPLDPTPATRGPVIGDPDIPPLLIGAPGAPDLARPVLVEFTRQNPSLLARWEQIGGDYAGTLEAQIKTVAAPDVVRVREGQLGRWSHAGLLRPFSDAEIFDQLPGLLFGGARNAAFDPDGALWGVPHYHDAMFLACNRVHLEKVGGTAPTTLEQMAAYARELQLKHSLRNPISVNLAPKINANLPWWGLLKAADVSFERSEADPSNAVAVLEALKGMVIDDGTLDPGIERPDYVRLADGDCAFAIVGAYSGPQLLENQAPIEFAPLPGLWEPGRKSVSWTPLFALTNRPAPHPAAALLAVHLGLIDSHGGFWGPRHFALAGNLPPAYPNLLEETEIRSHFQQWIDPDIFSSVLASAEPVDFLWEPWYQSWEHRCQEAMMAALIGQTGPSSAIAAMRPVNS